MSHVFYVDVPYTYDYVWGRLRSGPDVLTRDFGVKFEFICNSNAKISEGDVHRVTVKDYKDEVFFLLKTGFKKVNTNVVDTFLSKKFQPGTSETI